MDDCRSAPRLIPIPKIRRHGVGIGLGVGAAGFEAVTGGCAGREGVAEHALPGLHDEVAERRQGQELAVREEVRPPRHAVVWRLEVAGVSRKVAPWRVSHRPDLGGSDVVRGWR